MPRLTIDLGKIEENTRLVADLLQPHGVRLVGVTKACLGNALVGQAMLEGGAAALADSRTENIANLKRHLPGAELHLMCSPVSGGRTGDPDLCFVSSADQARALRDSCHDGAAVAPRRDLRLCLTVETGDGREGVPAGLAADEAARIFDLDGVALVGLATNAACSRMPASLDDTLKSFYQSAARVLWRLGKKGAAARRQQGVSQEPSSYGKIPPFPVMSIGGSGFLRLLIGGAVAAPGGRADFSASPPLGAVTELRSGEAILLGRIPAAGDDALFLPAAHRDAFGLEGEVLEVFPKNGATQALLDFGLQDTGAGRLIPCRKGVSPGAATSDYLAASLSLPEVEAPVRVGNKLTFIPTYYALLAAMTSPFVEKVFV